MRPYMVVMLSPFFYKHLSFFKGVKYFSIEKLISQFSVKAFIVAILPRGAWFYVSCFNIKALKPVFKNLSSKFTAIVR